MATVSVNLNTALKGLDTTMLLSEMKRRMELAYGSKVNIGISEVPTDPSPTVFMSDFKTTGLEAWSLMQEAGSVTRAALPLMALIDIKIRIIMVNSELECEV